MGVTVSCSCLQFADFCWKSLNLVGTDDQLRERGHEAEGRGELSELIAAAAPLSRELSRWKREAGRRFW